MNHLVDIYEFFQSRINGGYRDVEIMVNDFILTHPDDFKLIQKQFGGMEIAEIDLIRVAQLALRFYNEKS